MKNNKGFSLVELIVVIAIMAILAAVAIPTFAGFITKANKGADQDFMAQTEYAITLANTANIDFKLKSVTVVVDANGEFDKVTYTYTITGENGDKNQDITETLAANAATNIADAHGAIDWAYKFKGYKGHTVTYTAADNKINAVKNNNG